ncbi:MAG TPA: (d)CMP kinase [Chloroflexi bacterium]|nr:MAG: cytidylate kinase [Anaerolineaceae bacterium 4572_5.1]HEY85357.1 (d)CMP kinase [Chloroflexota bacterium]
MKPRTVAIDGSAASGKSTLASALAGRLKYLYLDTGVMYRAVTWAALKQNVDINDEAAVSELAEKIDLQILPSEVDDGRQATILVNGRDVTWLIRGPEVNVNVSQVSSYPRVRQVLTRQQRKIAQQGPVVMAGRDIGTVVLPNADLKLFIVASAEVRARRRHLECIERGETLNFDELLASIIRRDKLDREKPISPMIPAQDAVIINTDGLSQQAVLERVLALMENS